MLDACCLVGGGALRDSCATLLRLDENRKSSPLDRTNEILTVHPRTTSEVDVSPMYSVHKITAQTQNEVTLVGYVPTDL